MFNGVCYWLFRQDMFSMCHRLPDLAQTRIRQCEQADHLYRHDGLAVDFDHKTLSVDGTNVDLTKTEFDILALFVQNEGSIFSREDILARVWKEQGLVVVDRTVDVHITRLRKKLGPYGKCIVNRTGYGYTFKW